MSNTAFLGSPGRIAWVFGSFVPASWDDPASYFLVSDDAADTNWSDGSAGDGVEYGGETLQANGVAMVFWSAVQWNGTTSVLIRDPSNPEYFYLCGDFDWFAFDASTVLGALGLNGDDTTNSVPYTYPLNFTGGSGHDFWAGNGFANSVTGADGNDTFTGGGGNDTLDGGAGSDSLDGGYGNDLLKGGGGNDNVVGGNGADTLFGGDGADSLSGGSGNDDLWGSLGNDTLAGGEDADRLGGGDGNDSLSGGTGNDSLWGNAGDDTITGGWGNDSLTGDDGADVFRFNATFGTGGKDTITDFAGGQDKLYVQQWLTNINNTGSLWSERLALGTAANEADDRFVFDGTTGNLYYDADGSGAGAQVQIATLTGVSSIAASDIVIV